MRSMGSFSFFWKVESDDSILKHKKILFPQFKNPERETHASLLAIINVFLFLKRAGYSKGFFAEHTKPTFVDIRRTHSLIPMLFAQSGLWTCAFQGRREVTTPTLFNAKKWFILYFCRLWKQHTNQVWRTHHLSHIRDVGRVERNPVTMGFDVSNVANGCPEWRHSITASLTLQHMPRGTCNRKYRR